MGFALFTLKASRKIYRAIARPYWLSPDCIIDRQKANDVIFDVLNSSKACMISRFGTTEIGNLSHYQNLTDSRPWFKKYASYITGNQSAPVWDPQHLQKLCIWSGFFPEDRSLFEQFARRYLQDIPEIDVLGSFNYTEKFMPLASTCRKVHLESMYPFFVNRPWTRYLAGKKVLVIHPFEQTIRHQWAIREKLFANPEILPECHLDTLKAVQSLGAEGQNFATWFDALQSMEDEIAKRDFDVALLGCGAYGIPLAAFIKRMGKKAIHLGGGLQLLFGIKGKRWEDNYHWTYPTKEKLNLNYVDLYNENWIRPLPEDIPSVAKKIENGCYW